MRRRDLTPFTLLFGLLFGLLLTLPFSEAQARSARADSFFVAAADTVRPLKERILLLKQALKIDRNDVEVLHALGRLYMAQHTIGSRAAARERFKEALVLDPQNVVYHTSYATLLRRQGFRYNSMAHFKTILEIDPDNAQAACEVGEFLIQDMFKYLDARRFDGGGSMRSFGLESRDEAASCFRYAIEKDPYCRRAYYGLGFLSLESGYPGDLVEVSRELLRHYPGDRDGLLFLGLGHQEMEDLAAADRTFRKALGQMGAQERWILESPDLIAGEEDRLALGRPARFGGGIGRAPLPDRLLDRFWQRLDPLFLTPFNERRVAHYGRVAYANLRFSLPDEGVEGWETDMGQVYIRFGRYLERERTIDPYREVWTYEDFSVSFYSYDSVHWRIDLLKEAQWTAGGYGRGEVLSPGFHRPDRYLDPYGEQKYALPCQVGIFKAPQNRIRLDLSWALPKAQVDYLQLYDTYQVALREGVFLFNDAGDAVERQVWRREVLKDTWRDTLKSKYLLDGASVTVEGGVIRLAVEVEDRAKGAVGTFRDTLDLEPFDGARLGLSSALLATEVTENEDGALTVTPNPTRAYGPSELLTLYFEIYSLSQDVYGQTRYRVEYRVGPPKVSRLGGRLDWATQKRLGLDRERWTISVTTEYRGNRPDEPLYLGIGLKELNPGLQLLSLVVTDQATGVQAARETLFRIVGSY